MRRSAWRTKYGRGVPADASLPAVRELRESVLLAVEVSRFGNSAVTKHRLRNLSPNGSKLDKAGALRRGETILIVVGSSPAIGATVMWVDHGEAGVKFFETIDPATARSKTIVKTTPTRRALAPSDSSPERKAELAGWLANLDNAYG